MNAKAKKEHAGSGLCKIPESTTDCTHEHDPDVGESDDPETVLMSALHHFGQTPELMNGGALDVDAMLEKVLEANCHAIEEELQRQLDDQIEAALQKELDSQMDKYLLEGEQEFERQVSQGAEGMSDAQRPSRKRELDGREQNWLEDHLLVQKMQQMLKMNESPPSVADVNGSIQKIIEEYQQVELKGELESQE